MKTSLWSFKRNWYKSFALALTAAMLVSSGAMASKGATVNERIPGQIQTKYECQQGVVVPGQTTVTFTSNAKHDGWILESGENSNRGGLDSRATTLIVGDDGRNQQYRSFLSFNTMSIPDNACITSTKLTLKRDGVIMGSDPFKTHGDLRLEILNSTFSTNLALRLLDFSAPPSPGSSAETINSGVVELSDANLQYISKIGFTQFRLRFASNTDRDRKADYIRFFSGSANDSNKIPKLVVTYYLPPESPKESPKLISPANGTRVPAGDIKFEWSTVPGATEYKLEYNGTSSGVCDWNSTTNCIVNLPPGDYNWKVVARNLGGESPSSEIWTFKSVSIPPASALISPNKDVILPAGDITFTWGTATDAAEYKLEYIGASSGICNWNSATSCIVNLSAGKYTWRVNARNVAGEGPYSEEWSFTALDPISSLTLVAPKNGAITFAGTTNFTWNPVPENIAGATAEYQFEYMDMSGTPIYNSGWVSEENHSIPLNAGTYSWHVKARNAISESDWSETWTLAVSAPPTFIFPSNGSTVFSGITNFTWNPVAENTAVSGATEYQFEYYMDVSSIPIGNSGWISATNYPLHLIAGNHSWHVKARNAISESDWSDTWALTVSDPPTLISPSNSATLPAGEINFTWNPVNGATEYYLEYTGTSSGICNWNATTSCKVNLSAGIYTWRVKVRNVTGESGWSNEWSFKAVNPPPAPTLVWPKANEVIGTEFPLTSWNFKWNAASDATEYYFEYSGNSSGNSGWISTTNYSAVATAGTVWHVKARNVAGESNWSDTWTVTGDLFWTNFKPPYTGYLDSTTDHTYRFTTGQTWNITLSVKRTSGDLNMVLYFYDPQWNLIEQQGPGDNLSINKTIPADVDPSTYYWVVIKDSSGSGNYELQLIQN
jgi:hypothetical protein